MIRVAANLSWLRPGAVGGSEEYTVRLLNAVLDAAPGDVELRIFGSRELRDAHPGLVRAQFEIVPGPLQQRAYRVAAESTVVHRATRDADLVHHFGGTIPARNHGNDIVTVHDLQPFHLPANFSAAKRRYLGWSLPRAAAAAQLICTPSQWVADTVVEAFDIDATRVRAISSTYSTAVGIDSGLDDHGLADSLGSGPVLLYPAITHPHKNHRLLLDAADGLREHHRDLVVVLTGSAGRAEAEVVARIASARVRVVRPGRVAESTLLGLLARADVLAFPSRYEGFGLPVLEAMRAGTPVVAADATALPEVVGDAALLAGPDDVHAWTEQIHTVLTDPAVQDRLRTAGRLRAEHYSPAVAADRLLAAWRSVR